MSYIATSILNKSETYLIETALGTIGDAASQPPTPQQWIIIGGCAVLLVAGSVAVVVAL